MKSKKCAYCDEEIDYEEWVRGVLNPYPQLWAKKKYCCMDCCHKFNYRKQKERLAEKRRLGVK
jgi:hypothetical protein